MVALGRVYPFCVFFMGANQFRFGSSLKSEDHHPEEIVWVDRFLVSDFAVDPVDRGHYYGVQVLC